MQSPFSPHPLSLQSILYYNISQSLFRQIVRACSMTISFSCLYWLSEALVVLRPLACHLSLLFFSPSADDPRLRRWICEYASCKGLWLLLLFIREDHFIFESIAGVWTCEDSRRVFKGSGIWGDIHQLFLPAYHFSKFPFSPIPHFPTFTSSFPRSFLAWLPSCLSAYA